MKIRNRFKMTKPFSLFQSVVLRQPLDETTTPPASRAVISSSGDQTAKKSTASPSNDVTATTTSGGGESLNNSHNGGNRPSRNPSSNNITGKRYFVCRTSYLPETMQKWVLVVLLTKLASIEQ